MSFVKLPRIAFLAVFLLLPTSLPSRSEAASRPMPLAASALDLLHDPSVSRDVARQLRQVYASAEQVEADMATFRTTEAALLKDVSTGKSGAKEKYLKVFEGVIGCKGAVPADPSMAKSAALGLVSTTGQYPEFEPYIKLRDTLIQAALSAVQSAPPTRQQCKQYKQLADQLGIPATATAVYGC